MAVVLRALVRGRGGDGKTAIKVAHCWQPLVGFPAVANLAYCGPVSPSKVVAHGFWYGAWGAPETPCRGANGTNYFCESNLANFPTVSSLNLSPESSWLCSRRLRSSILFCTPESIIRRISPLSTTPAAIAPRISSSWPRGSIFLNQNQPTCQRIVRLGEKFDFPRSLRLNPANLQFLLTLNNDKVVGMFTRKVHYQPD